MNSNKNSDQAMGRNVNAEFQVSVNEEDQLYSNALTVI